MTTLEAGMKNKGTCKMPEEKKKKTNKQKNKPTEKQSKMLSIHFFSGPKALFTVKLDLVFKLSKG